jgi:hypothetical protein
MRIMIELTAGAERHLDEYLGELRASLTDCPSVSIEDVERDVMEHIEKSLCEAATPVDLPALREVLELLGSPSQWIPDEELSWKRRGRLTLRRGRLAIRQSLLKLWSGPEDFRLAYLSIATLALALALLAADAEPLWPIAFVALSFILARTSLAAAETPEALGAQRWLVYPVLVLVYLPLAAGLLFWTVPVAVVAGLALDHSMRHEQYPLGPHAGYPVLLIVGYLFVASSALWWTLLGAIGWRWPALVHNTFYPLAGGFRRRHGLLLGIVGLLILVVTLVFGGSVMWG